MEPLRGWRRVIAWLVAIAVGIVATYALGTLVCNSAESIEKRGLTHREPFVVFWSAVAILILALLGVFVWLFDSFIVVAIAERIMKKADERLDYPKGCCHSCGYNLTGNVSGRCPECGTEIPA
jgi:uncharacterized paraquat-inducible protein A